MANPYKRTFRQFCKDNRKTIITLSIFIVAVVVAVVSFAIFFTNIGKKEPDVYEIEPDPDESIPGYSKDFTFYYYLDGSSSEIKAKEKQVTELYTKHLKLAYSCFTVNQHVDGYTNMYDINNHIGEELIVSPLLYTTLKEAYEYSLVNDNYSIFASPIYAYWDFMFTKDKEVQQQYDPLKNASFAKYVSDITGFINDEANYSITFNDEKNSVKVEISTAYKFFIQNQGISAGIFPVVSLNILEDAYMMDYIYSVMKENNLKYGYLQNRDGQILVFEDITKMYVTLFDLSGTDIYLYGHINFDGQMAICQNRFYEISKRTFSPYYVISKDGEKYYRNRYIDISTGYQNNYFITTTAYSVAKTLVETTLLNNELLLADDLEEAKLTYKEFFSETALIFTLKNVDKEVYCSQKMKDYVTIYQNLQYNVYII